MKELHKEGDYAIAIYDDNNYVVYNHTKPVVNKNTGTVTYRFSYHSSMLGAISELSRLVANDVSSDMESWIKSLGGTLTRLESLLVA